MSKSGAVGAADASTHKRQHWVPKTYLGAWCDPNLKNRAVHRYSTDGVYLDWRPPSRICAADDLYTITGPNGERDLAVEHALNKLEDAFARTRRKLLEPGLPLTTKARHELIWFIAALRNRTPAMRDHFQAFLDRVLEVGESAERAMKRATPEERQRMARASMSPTSRGADKSMSLSEWRKLARGTFGERLPSHITAEAELLERMQLVILRAPAGQSFITSDSPVAWWDPTVWPKRRQPLGLRMPNIQITLPLSPTMCALVSHHPTPEYIDVYVGDVVELNARTLAFCNEIFIAHTADLVVDWVKHAPAAS